MALVRKHQSGLTTNPLPAIVFAHRGRVVLPERAALRPRPIGVTKVESATKLLPLWRSVEPLWTLVLSKRFDAVP